MNNLPTVLLWRSYRPLTILKASIIGLLFTVLYGGIVVTPLIMISMLYVPYIEYFLLLIYISFSLVISNGIARSMETLKHYTVDKTISYDTIQVRWSVLLAAVTFVILTIVYLTYLQ